LETTDTTDIRAALRGDDEAFRRLVERYEPKVARLMWRFSRDPAQCEELIQEAFVEAYTSLSTYRGDAPFLHWLRRIGTRVGYRFWTRRDRARAEVPLSEAAPLAGPGDPVEPAAAADIVEHLLGQLPPDDRLVLTLEYLDGCPIGEIAGQTGWTPAAVKMRSYRAKARLREIAEREHLLEALGWTN